MRVRYVIATTMPGGHCTLYLEGPEGTFQFLGEQNTLQLALAYVTDSHLERGEAVRIEGPTAEGRYLGPWVELVTL